VRAIRTAGIIILGAVGALLWLSSIASAQVGNPTSEPFKPYSPTDQPAMFIPESSPSTAPASAEAPATEPVAEELVAAPVEAVPEQDAAPAAAVEPGARRAAKQPGTAQRQVEPVLAEAAVSPEGSTDTSVASSTGPIERVKTVLAELATACQVGVSFPTGGPVLAFAILAAALGLDGQRFQRTRWLADEDAPELLYAGDVIAPG
jgi:cytoskeletal protein RodZ